MSFWCQTTPLPKHIQKILLGKSNFILLQVFHEKLWVVVVFAFQGAIFVALSFLEYHREKDEVCTTGYKN